MKKLGVVSLFLSIILLGFVIISTVSATAGDIVRVSISSEGVEANGYSSLTISISSDGTYVAFDSSANNLVNLDTNNAYDVFVHSTLTGETERVSIGSDGAQGNGTSLGPSISSDGRYIAFFSTASNIVEGDTNTTEDVYVHDRDTGETSFVSKHTNGSVSNGISMNPSISSDGRYVVFESYATNLVDDDTNDSLDIFVHDRQNGETTRISVASDGSQANGVSIGASISGSGQFIVFGSRANNLVPNDTNDVYDIFIFNQLTHETQRVSVSSTGDQADGSSSSPNISSDGRYIVYTSTASNLVPGDLNNQYDVFRYDVQTGETSLVSVASDGTQGNGDSRISSISSDGRYISFVSSSTNLVSGDTNNLDDVFVHDFETGETKRITETFDGVEANGNSSLPEISSDGGFIVFVSSASNLVSGDNNGTRDAFLAELSGQSPAPTPSPTPGLEPYTIQGRVTDGSGNGVGGVTITASSESEYYAFIPIFIGSGGQYTSNGFSESSRTAYEVVTDADGYYTIESLSGAYTLEAVKKGIEFTPSERDIDSTSSGSQDFEVLILEPVIKENMKVLTDLTNQYLDPEQSDGITFTFTQSTSEIEGLKIGDIIVSDGTDDFPEGYLREVTDVSYSGDSVIVTTKQGTLETGVEDGSAYYHGILDPATTSPSSALAGVTMREPTSRGDNTFVLDINNVVLYDDDEDLATTYDQVRLNGSIEFDTDYEFYIHIEDSTLQQLTFADVKTLHQSLEVGWWVSKSLEEEYVLATFDKIPAFTVMMGPVPVLVKPTLEIVIGVKGTATAGISTSVSQDISTRLGLTYIYPDQWVPINDISYDFNWDGINSSLSASIKGYGGVRFNLFLYGASGPYIEMTPFLQAVVQPTQTPWWVLYAGIDAPIGFRFNPKLYDIAEWIGVELPEYEYLAISVKTSIAQADTNRPPYQPSTPTPADEGTTTDTSQNLLWVGGDPDGDESVTYDVYFGADGDIPALTLICDDVSALTCDPGTLIVGTAYNWQVIATDGAETTLGPVWRFSVVEEPNQPPNTPSSPTPSDGATINSTAQLLSWTGGDPDTGDIVTYDVYMGAGSESSIVLICDDTSVSNCDPGTLALGTTYYWQVTATDGELLSMGPVWNFTVGSEMPQGTTTRVSTSSVGTEGNDDSKVPVISADGRYVAFYSYASNFITNDTNGTRDVFVKDLITGEISLISRSSDGTIGNASSGYYGISISANGRYVVFSSQASNLVAGDTNGCDDIFVNDMQTNETTLISQGAVPSNDDSLYPSISDDGRYIVYESRSTNLTEVTAIDDTSHIYLYDMQTGETELVSKNTAGGFANGDSSEPMISGDGNFIVYYSAASDLIPVDANGNGIDVYLFDIQNGETSLVSVSSEGVQAPNNDIHPESSISGDGHYVAFSSPSSGLVIDDTNGKADIFVHDVITGETKIITVSFDGNPTNGHSTHPSISDDGRFVVFESYASNLVEGDTNGKHDVFVYDSLTDIISRISLGVDEAEGNGYSYGPDISADGTSITFFSSSSNLVIGDTNSVWDVFIYDVSD